MGVEPTRLYGQRISGKDPLQFPLQCEKLRLSVDSVVGPNLLIEEEIFGGGDRNRTDE